MRLVLAWVLLGGCLGGGGGASRPGVMPLLSELPGNPGKRDAILDQSGQTPGPEHRRNQLPPKQRKAETAAAAAAAILGNMFSKTQNVTLGSAGTFEENHLVAPPPPPVTPRAHDADRDAGRGGTPAERDPADADRALVPWIKLTPDEPAR